MATSNNIFANLSDEVGNDGGDCEVSFKGGVERALNKALGETGVLRKAVDTKKGGAGEDIRVIVQEVLASLQPVLASVVSTAVATATREIIVQLKGELASLAEQKVELNRAKAQIQSQRCELERLEQYTRRDNVRIFGMEEVEGENTSQVVVQLAKEIGVDMTEADLSTCHRLGVPGTGNPGSRRARGKPRPIIARFCRRDVKASLMRNKKELKKKEAFKAVFLADDLTRLRSRLIQAMKKDENITRVWTVEGKVFYVIKRGGREGKRSLDSIDDLVHLGWSEETIREAGLFLEL